MNSGQLLKIVEHFSQKSEAGYGGITVTQIPDQNTVFVEQFDGVGRSIVMDQYNVGGATYWAGYSSRTETVYISLAA
jgi:meiotically up-regulated gene 157 (Mug157) protein